jgi:transmembrane sensor
MEDQEIILLLEKYRNGTLTVEEKAILESWYLHESVYSKHEISDEALLRNLDLIAKKLPLQYKNTTTKLWPQPAPNWLRGIAAVAAAVAMMTLGIWLYYSSNLGGRHPDPSLSSRVSRDLNDIAPGKNGATITLANGKVIQLSDAKTGVVIGDDKLAYNDGSSVGSRNEFGTGSRNSKGGGPDPDGSGQALRQDDVMQMTASTAKGQTYQFTLPDGTKVWLNAASSLKFPSNFNGAKQRRIELTGEAYLEVSKDKLHPFIVESSGQTVEVLGTHFNISSYADEGSVRTTLLEGSVRVSDGKGAERSIVLKPNQQSVVSGANRIKVEQVDAQSAVDWKQGTFVFNKASLEEILRKITRWYDVDIVDLRKQQNDITFSGKMSRYDNISKVLSKLALTGEVRFKIEGRKIIVQ